MNVSTIIKRRGHPQAIETTAIKAFIGNDYK